MQEWITVWVHVGHLKSTLLERDVRRCLYWCHERFNFKKPVCSLKVSLSYSDLKQSRWYRLQFINFTMAVSCICILIGVHELCILTKHIPDAYAWQMPCIWFIQIWKSLNMNKHSVVQSTAVICSIGENSSRICEKSFAVNAVGQLRNSCECVRVWLVLFPNVCPLEQICKYWSFRLSFPSISIFPYVSFAKVSTMCWIRCSSSAQSNKSPMKSSYILFFSGAQWSWSERIEWEQVRKKGESESGCSSCSSASLTVVS